MRRRPYRSLKGLPVGSACLSLPSAAHGRCARQGRATFLEAARKVQLGERTEKHYSGLVIILRCSIRQLLAARLLPFAVQGVARPGLRWRSSMSMEGTGLC